VRLRGRTPPRGAGQTGEGGHRGSGHRWDRSHDGIVFRVAPAGAGPNRIPNTGAAITNGSHAVARILGEAGTFGIDVHVIARREAPGPVPAETGQAAR
jgi:hypothetical protein